VKFQTFSSDLLVSTGAGTTPYQRRSGAADDQRALLSALELPKQAWAELRDHALEAGLSFLSSPFDLPSAELLVDLGVPALKLGSGELTNLPLLREVSRLGVPLLVSTGMASADEVDAAVQACADAPGLLLFHCVSAYPAPIDECNLSVIPALAARHGVPVGWSDHTPGMLTAIGAVALGAAALEKHITTDRTLSGPDHAASLEPAEMAEYVEQTRLVARATGDGVKRRTPAEQENAPLVRRSWHAAVDLAAGHVIGAGDVVTLRPESGISPAVDLVGQVVARPVAAGSPVRTEDVAGSGT
jgi:N-acetylneuraminate synthase/N,N'-diacetyllegionaminate synthase